MEGVQIALDVQHAKWDTLRFPDINGYEKAMFLPVQEAPVQEAPWDTR
jgi:hypothetical protein